MTFSLEECYTAYKEKALPRKKPQLPRPLLDSSLIVKMRRINYFRSRPRHFDDNIFSKHNARNHCRGLLPRTETDTTAASLVRADPGSKLPWQLDQPHCCPHPDHPLPHPGHEIGLDDAEAEADDLSHDFYPVSRPLAEIDRNNTHEPLGEHRVDRADDPDIQPDPDPEPDPEPEPDPDPEALVETRSRPLDPKDEDCSIAEEFNTGEEHISADLARREGEKTFKLPKLTNTPTSKGGRHLDLACDRKRSITTLAAFNTRKLFARANTKPLLVSHAHPPPHPDPHTGLYGRLAAKENQAAPSIPHGEGKLLREDHPKKVTFCNKPSNPLFIAQRTRPIGLERLRTNSTDSYADYATGILKRKECVYDVRNVCATPSNGSCGFLKGVQEHHLQKDIKDRFSVLLNKGPHKFSNTSQAQPKPPHKRNEPEESAKTTDRPELPSENIDSGRLPCRRPPGPGNTQRPNPDSNIFKLLGR